MLLRVTQRSGVLHWLKRMTALAPAVWAFATLSAKLQPPRWISAIRAGDEAREVVEPARVGSERRAGGGPSVNAPSHPLVLARGGVRLMSIGRHGGGHRSQGAASHAARRVRGGGAGVSCRIGCATVKSNWWVSTDPAGRLERLDHVVDARVVPRRRGGARAAVRVGDRLERGLVLADALERHAAQAACRRCCSSGSRNPPSVLRRRQVRPGAERRAHRRLLRGGRAPSGGPLLSSVRSRGLLPPSRPLRPRRCRSSGRTRACDVS